MKIKRIPLMNNEYILDNYWNKHIDNWNISSNKRMNFLQQVNTIWLYVAYIGNECCGLLVNEEGDKNAIWLFHVQPHLRGMGIGSALFNKALSNINNVWNAGIGSGYWWQGVPVGQGDEFLEKRGFKWSWTSIDVIMPLRNWGIHSNETVQHISKISREESAKLLNMLKSEDELCNWVPIYKTLIDNAQFESIFVARKDSEIVGCSILLNENDIRWSMNFPGRTGGIGCLGVMKLHRNKGIGQALVIAINNELKYLGFEQSYIGYTWLEKWYGKLGFHTIYKYRMGQKNK